MHQLIYIGVMVATASAYIAEDNPDAVINGYLANIQDFPYYAALVFNESILCGGAFIKRDLVLTAAHCIEDNITVYPGITTLSDFEHQKGYPAKLAVAHPIYLTTSDYNYDIGLIRLWRKIKLGPETQLIDLPTGPPEIYDEGTVVGFGDVQCIGKRRCHIFSKQTSHLRYADVIVTFIENDGAIQTRSGNNKNTCYGDSGGPIVQYNTIIGVVSDGQFGDCTGYDIQAPVFARIDWIGKTMARI